MRLRFANSGHLAKGLEMRIGAGEVGRFDQRNTMFSRVRDTERSDPSLLEMGRAFYGEPNLGDRTGYTLKDWALNTAAWYVERKFGRGNLVGDFGLYEWGPDPEELMRINRISPEKRWNASDPGKMSQSVKEAARLFGASLVGICRLDQRWLYSHRFNPLTFEHVRIDIPEEFEYAVVLAHEMDYELIRTSPAYTENAATGHGYSMMAYVAGSMAHYIRTLGYKAIPCGNDTGLSIPLAVDAGLGELGRHGLLITKTYGPRIRISKVLTDLPLMPDRPVEFGAKEFCARCKRCAEECPGTAISFGGPTTRGLSPSNNDGIYKYYVQPEKCFAFWARNRGSCGTCIRVCPYNKPLGRIHDLVRHLTNSAPVLDPLWVKIDRLLGYGRRVIGE